MNKFLIILGFLALLNFSCDDDDVCEDSTTPFLVVVFRDKNNIEVNKTIDRIYVHRFDNTSNSWVQVVDKSVTDSIKIPLLIGDETQTKLRFKRNLSTSQEDIITVNYQVSRSYVSKACGFKTTYKNVTYTQTLSYFHHITAPINEITDETQTHLYIYF